MLYDSLILERCVNIYIPASVNSVYDWCKV